MAQPQDKQSGRRTLTLPVDPQALAALDIVDRLRAAGHGAFPVGGCVRDLVAGQPPKDWDVATSALPDEIRAIFGRVIEVGAAFGVLRVPVHIAGQRVEIEVATFRADGPYSDGRRPDGVRFTDAREDVLRRDFTLNGLLLDPGPQGQDGRRTAEVIDWVGGVADLDDGLLRAIGNAEDRFSEDGLRILRAVRFAARFELRIEDGTRAAIIAMADRLAHVSRERIRGELEGALRPPWAATAVRLLAELGLHTIIWPKLADRDPDLSRAEARLAAICAYLAEPEPEVVADPLPSQRDLDLPLALAALLLDLGPPDRRGVELLARDLRLSGPQGQRLARLWKLAELASSLASALDTTPEEAVQTPAWIRLLRQADADAALLLAMAVARPDSTDIVQFLRAMRAGRAGASASAWRPRLWVDGSTLRELGHEPSPAFKHALLAAEDVQLAGGTRQHALDAALALLSAWDAG